MRECSSQYIYLWLSVCLLAWQDVGSNCVGKMGIGIFESVSLLVFLRLSVLSAKLMEPEAYISLSLTPAKIFPAVLVAMF